MSYFQAKLLNFYDTAVNVFLAVLQLSAVILSGERSSAPSVSPAHSSAAWWSSSLGSWHYIQPAFSIRITSRVSVLIRLSRLHFFFCSAILISTVILLPSFSFVRIAMSLGFFTNSRSSGLETAPVRRFSHFYDLTRYLS